MTSDTTNREKCPNCGSTSNMLSWMLVIFQYECLSCGYMW